MDLIESIKENARKELKRIVLPEAYEERTLKAADISIQDKIADIIILGSPESILADADRLGLENIKDATIVDPKNHDKKEQYAKLMVKLRGHKGLTYENALELIEDPLYLGTLMIKNGDADGEGPGYRRQSVGRLRGIPGLGRQRPDHRRHLHGQRARPALR